MKKIILLIALILLGASYWYFIGVAPFTQRANDAIPTGDITVLRQGQFNQIDSIHKGSGTAKVIKKEDKYYLHLENFKVTNGPDLYIGISKNKEISSTASVGEYKTLQPLKGNEGNQTYEISKEDAENFASVIIWCERFSVLFSAATLSE